jgi:monoterpene epsilon-lactone hydrolase
MVQKEVLLWMADLYLNGADARAPYTSPVNADLRGLPPILVQSGTGETLLDDAIRIAERLHASDVQVKLSVWPNMIHVWPMFTPMLSEARDACEEIGEFIKKRTA